MSDECPPYEEYGLWDALDRERQNPFRAVDAALDLAEPWEPLMLRCEAARVLARLDREPDNRRMRRAAEFAGLYAVGRLAPAQPRPRWPAGTAGCLVVAAGVELLARELGRLSGADSRAFVGELARGAPLHVLLSSLEVGQGIFDRLELVFGGVRQVLEDAGRRVYRPAIYGFLVRELDGAGLFRGVVGLVHLHHPDWLGMALVSPDVASAVADAAVATNDLGLARVLVEHAETDTLLESIIAYDSLGMATWLANLDIDGFMRALAAVGAEFAISARLLPVIQRATQLVTVDYEFTAFGDSDGDSSDSSDSDGDDRLRCCVCRGRRDRGRLACGHVMCDGCATSWAARTRAQMSCPLCRRPLARAI